MRRRLFSCLLVLSAACGNFNPTRADANELESFIDSIATAAIESQKFAGISIGVARGDEVLLEKGYGLADLENNIPATKHTVYRIGSITKQFTAAAILRLVEDEQLALDDHVNKWLAGHLSEEYSKQITVRHLLQHTSGIKSFTSLPTYLPLMRNDIRHEDLTSRFRDLELEFEPGSTYRYSNSGYYLLGIMIEKISDQSFESFVQTRLLAPLKLQQTYYDRHARLIPHRARGYNRYRDKFVNAPYLSMSQPFSAGAMASTVGDLLRWTRSLHTGKVLSSDSYAAMTKRGRLADDSPIGYGFGMVVSRVHGRRSLGHSGGINGFLSDVAYLPDSEITVVVLSNCTTGVPAEIRNQIIEHLLPPQNRP